MPQQVAVNIDTYRELRKLYEEAKNNNKDTFMYKGNELVTSYAYYMLCHMENGNQQIRDYARRKKLYSK